MTNGSSSNLGRELVVLYDAYRSSKLSLKYYAVRLVQTKRWNLAMEIIIALTSSSSLATWKFWQTGWGEPVWIFLGILTTILAILKPILQTGKKIEFYQGLWSSYTNLYLDLRGIVEQVSVQHDLDEPSRALMASSKKRLRELAPQDEPEAIRKKKLIQALTDEVNREIPPTSLWVP